MSNRRLDENSGRAEKLATRARLLRERGWELRIGYVEPTATRLPRGIVRCVRLAREADVINSVSNPPHLQIAGAIAARATGTPWVAEFRDPLVTNPDVEPGSVAARLRRWLERYVLVHADRVVWYDGIQIPDNYFATTYPDVPTDRYRKLPPIGFERAAFDATTPRSFDQFTVTYAGSFYEGWIEPYTFLDGFGQYVDANPGAEPQALFYGDWNDEYDRAARAHGVVDHVTPKPFVDHDELIGVLKGSDVLLYVGGDDPRNRLNLPSKLYDYIGAGRPILAVVDPSFRVAEVIRDNGLGTIVEPDDAGSIRTVLERIRSGEFVYDPDPAAAFTRERSTAAYIETVEAVTE
ncbi:glycosyltransferase [Halococcus agarilyticus]|uniref:glycosyltransferase n=1 Tax=Halococcus agarilyticus TaxID=1232219 RepID=UPI000A94A885|nr:glycosyltransferase [Halococcus agarilyticus]